MRQHRHEFLEVAVVLSGEALHVTGVLRHPIRTGDALVLSSRRPHGYENPCGLNLLNILVREDALSRLSTDLRQLPGYHALFGLEALRWSQRSYSSRLRLSAADLFRLCEWAGGMEKEIGRPAHGGHALAEAYLTLILGLLINTYDGKTSSAARPESSMGELLSWIEAHLPEKLTVQLLAQHARMSLRSFHRHFLAATGQSPFDYLLDQRLNRARNLLAHHPMVRVGEVATRCGFEDSNYFSRLFRTRSGFSPRDFRARKNTRRNPKSFHR
jgi:AraC-like DNA-binding protein